ncbi:MULTISPECIES: hypothetical protein [Ralstonia]|uniref:Uncharacterized protein n=2 Tax=Ralstonia TaxID=48736 RepID=A0AAD2F604_9RALS|nr:MULTISPECIES: hypothetical protein [Ralstonia]NMV39937.1 hypothetical protein [Ralstonia insidiosa]CAJ0807607.1 hypothetical protein R77560_04599 [Ralstonia sp. LMG 18095]
MKENRPFKFDYHTGEVGHSVVIGPVGAGKTVPAELLRLWATGHTGGTVSITQASTPKAIVSKRGGKKN